MKDERFEWQTRCEFNAYCKQALRNELIDVIRERKRRQKREVIFSDLTPHEEKQLYSVDAHFDDSDDHAFRVRRLGNYPKAPGRGHADPAGREERSHTVILFLRQNRR